MTADGFSNAVLYGGEDDEEYWNTHPEDYLDNLFSNYLWTKGETMRQTIARCAPVTVVGMNPEAADYRWLARLAGNAAENLSESVDEEYGDPNRVGDREALPFKPLESAMVAAVCRVFRDHGGNWRCEKVGEREYSEEELLGILELDEDNGASE